MDTDSMTAIKDKGFDANFTNCRESKYAGKISNRKPSRTLINAKTRGRC